MGLDSYLHRKTYVQNWEHYSEKRRHEVVVKRGGEVVPHIKIENVSYIIESVGYWRKFHSLHTWFINNTGSDDQQDDCKDRWVTIENLRELNEILKGVIETPFDDEGNPLDKEDIEIELGFVAEDDWNYLNKCKETIKLLDQLISEHDSAVANGYDLDYTYRGSW